jgi:hypothetical protein
MMKRGEESLGRYGAGDKVQGFYDMASKGGGSGGGQAPSKQHPQKSTLLCQFALPERVEERAIQWNLVLL